MQAQCGTLERYIGLFIDWHRGFDPDAGLGDIQGPAVDEVVHTVAVPPGDADWRRIG